MTNEFELARGRKNREIKVQRSFVIIGIALFGLFMLATESYVIVDSGHVGVVRYLGAVQPNALPEGFHLKKPFLDRVEQVDIRLTRAESAATAASKDLQTVSTRVTVQYSLIGAVAPMTYQKIGVRDVVATTLVAPAILESVKAITAQYTAEQLITKRAEVKLAIQDAINTFIGSTLEEKDIIGALRIANVAITDFDFSPEFNRAIEEKVKAEQDALKAENDKIRIVTQAEAAAAQRNLAADARAYEIETESKAKAEAIRREAEALRDNPELIQLRMAEKWDGVLPRVSGENALPILNLGSLGESK
ncbi:MAG: prohibitin family protein [Pseudomonadota bacterium]